ncbi:MAG: glutathione S-transferase family protein [Oceanicoccus sp.]
MEYQHIKLYHYPLTRSARVKWLLHECVGDDFDVERVSLYEGEQYQPTLLQKNPNHGVPILEITLSSGETKVMFESGAMLSFLADSFPQKKLAPPPEAFSLQRADYLQMLHFGTSWMDMMLWQIRIHKDVLPDAEKDQRTIDRYFNKFEMEVEPQLVQRLETSTYICGDQFTAADCVIAHNIMWGKSYGLCSSETLAEYLSKMSSRPAFLQAFADADQFRARAPEGSVIDNKFTG